MSLTLQPLSIEDGEDVYTMLQHIDAVANGFNHRSHFVTGDDRQLHHGVTAQVCVEVRPAEAHVGYLYHHFAGM